MNILRQVLLQVGLIAPREVSVLGDFGTNDMLWHGYESLLYFSTYLPTTYIFLLKIYLMSTI